MWVIEDELVPVATNNDEMLDAIHDARASIGKFFEAYKQPRANQTDFHIKARFEDGDTCEHIWLSDLDFQAMPATGVVVNEPGIGTLRYLERVPFLPDQISDWMYREDAHIVGGFTTKVLVRARLTEEGLMGLQKPRFVM